MARLVNGTMSPSARAMPFSVAVSDCWARTPAAASMIASRPRTIWVGDVSGAGCMAATPRSRPDRGPLERKRTSDRVTGPRVTGARGGETPSTEGRTPALGRRDDMSETTREARFSRDRDPSPAGAAATPDTKADEGFPRTIGLRSAITINMTQMCGIGPFVTIPLMIATLGGPQAIFGWIVGAILALVDGLVWAELGAAMPGAGGTYLYLREGFQYRTGRLMPFLFVWTAMFTIPLIMATGVIGLVQYLGYLIPHMSWVEIHAISLAGVGIVLFALWRRIESIGTIGAVLGAVSLPSLGVVIVAAATHFHPV